MGILDTLYQALAPQAYGAAQDRKERIRLDSSNIDAVRRERDLAELTEKNRRDQELYNNQIAENTRKVTQDKEDRAARQGGTLAPPSAQDYQDHALGNIADLAVPPPPQSIPPAPTQANIITPTGAPRGKPVQSAKDVLAKVLAQSAPPPAAATATSPSLPISQPTPPPQGAPGLPGAPALLPQSTITPNGSGVAVPTPTAASLNPIIPQAPPPSPNPVDQILQSYAAKNAGPGGLVPPDLSANATPVGSQPADIRDARGNRELSHSELEAQNYRKITIPGIGEISIPTHQDNAAAKGIIDAYINSNKPGEPKDPNLYEVRAKGWITAHPDEAKGINPSKPLFNQLPVKAQQEVVDQVQQGAAENKVTDLQRQRQDLMDKRFDTYSQHADMMNQLITQNLLTLSNQQGGDAVSRNVQSVLTNPDSYDKLDPKAKAAVNSEWTKATGLPIPAPLSTAAKTTEEAAKITLGALNAMQRIARQYPDIIGPVAGRLAAGEVKWGSPLFPRDKDKEAAAYELFTRSVYVYGIESKAILGGRPNQQFMQSLKDVSAQPKQAQPLFDAAIKSAKFHGASVLVNNEKERFGGSGVMRPNFPKQVDEYGGEGTFQEFQNSRGQGAANATGQTPIPTVSTKADFDKLPSGAVYLEDGKKYRKP